MAEGVLVEPEGETPVNPYSLLEAVNSSSETAHTAWLIFLAIMAYLTIAVAGVSHKDLLLETPVTLPIMQVSVQQTQFFLFAPVILMLFHLGVVSQLVLLARKTLEFDHAVRALEVTDRRTHPLRLELHNFFFVQAVAGPHRSAVMGAFLHGMTWLTLVVLPVVLLLFIQISFLPYHDVTITWAHRICLVLDIAMLVLIGVFLMRVETSFFKAFWRTSITKPVSFLVTTAVLAAIAFFSFFVATVPGEMLDRATQTLLRPQAASAHGTSRHAEFGFSLPFLPIQADGSLFGRFHRNLVVTDTDLVKDQPAGIEDASISLRDRDLRYARLDRSDLHKADLTGVNLEGATLVGANLEGARLACTDINELLLSESRGKANCVNAKAAVFTRAKMIGAQMSGIDLTDARLDEADLTGANLSYTLATGANFSSAQMEKADLTGGVHLEGANMLLAGLRGADLFGARLQGADLSTASLVGAVLVHARLEGANLSDADLEGADLRNANLLKVQMSGANIRAADLRGALIWETSPPARESIALADLSELKVRPASGEELSQVKDAVGQIGGGEVKARVMAVMAPVLGSSPNQSWGNSPDRQTWAAYVATTQAAPQVDYGAALTDYLAGVMCKARYANGSVATGIARRAQGIGFRGNLQAIYDQLRAGSCSAGKAVPDKVMQRLSAAIDMAKGN
ncbi:MAG: pentapeptide repeat-containing protein [Hyphomicrobiaceae bacterium]